MGEFFKRIKAIRNPEIENGIKSGDPYEICDLLEKTKGGIYLSELEDAIIKTGDIVQIYEFLFMAVDMGIPRFDRERFENIIRESNNPKLMCYCMEFVPGTNIEEMMKKLIDTHNTKYLSMILNNEEYNDLLEKVKMIYPNYEEIVEDSNRYDFFPSSLEEFEGYKDNIEELKRHIKKTQKPHLLTELANYIEYLNEFKNGSFDISDLTQLQEELKDPMQAYEYLASVSVKDKRGLIESVISSGRAKFMYYVYEYVPELKEEEKNKIRESILSINPQGKYGQALRYSDNGDQVTH